MKQIFDVPPFPKRTQSPDETAKGNQSKTTTVKINCEIDQDDTEERANNDILDRENFGNRLQSHAQKMKNLRPKNKETEINLKNQSREKMTHND